MRNMPPGIRALFTDTELAEIAARPVQMTNKRSRDAIDLAAAWAHQVEKIGDERELAGSLLLRDFLQEALDALRPPLRERLADWVAVVDDHYRGYTADDPAGRMGQVAHVDLNGRGWWWRRAPLRPVAVGGGAGFPLPAPSPKTWLATPESTAKR